MTEHEGAIEYDLLTKTSHEIRDVGRTLSWGALASFLLNSEPDSALAREIDDTYSLWAMRVKTNGLLADLYDMLAQINANLVAIGSHSKAKPVKPYPRPGAAEHRGDTKSIGKGALPKNELREWIEEKRRQHGGRR